jgi:hypothetical protein
LIVDWWGGIFRVMKQPRRTYTDKNETGCCPVPAVKMWDEAKVVWKNKKFIKDSTFNLMHIPLNMGQVIKRMWAKIDKAGAAPPTEEWMLLSYDPSPWKGEHYASVTKKVSDAENTTISGTFLTKVFEGPYREAKHWLGEMIMYAKEKGKEAKKVYFFYTTCPKCAKHYGKNYAIGFVEV